MYEKQRKVKQYAQEAYSQALTAIPNDCPDDIFDAVLVELARQFAQSGARYIIDKLEDG